ncbi:MAG: response regulator [Elusimicrobiales bacterium]|nr:response regulator [Elusimicrobiales bacterium]
MPKVILAVDDDPVLIALYKAVLAGYDLHTASNGDEALQLLETLAPGLVITDMEMPLVGGSLFLRALRQTLPKTVPIIVVSGNTKFEANTTVRMESSIFVPKPFEPEYILKLVKDHLGPPEASAAPDGAPAAQPQPEAEPARQTAGEDAALQPAADTPGGQMPAEAAPSQPAAENRPPQPAVEPEGKKPGGLFAAFGAAVRQALPSQLFAKPEPRDDGAAKAEAESAASPAQEQPDTGAAADAAVPPVATETQPQSGLSGVDSFFAAAQPDSVPPTAAQPPAPVAYSAAKSAPEPAKTKEAAAPAGEKTLNARLDEVETELSALKKYMRDYFSELDSSSRDINTKLDTIRVQLDKLAKK